MQKQNEEYRISFAEFQTSKSRDLSKYTEEIMGLFSKGLFEMDKGTTRFMMDVLIKKLQQELAELRGN